MRAWNCRQISAAAVLTTLLSIGPAAAAPTLETLQQRIDLAWTMVAASLVLMMQVGFLLLEAGMVRSKNSINVAQKNMLDMAFASVGFAAIGFPLAFGFSTWLSVGWDSNLALLSNLTPWQMSFFVFQLMFCATAATIVSGAVAERMKLVAYVIATVFLSVVIYPVFVHWAWGGVLHANSGAFLANAGFVDFAGSTVVHGTGAWIALAACVVLGARQGRFDESGRPIRIAGHSPVLTASGTLLLFVGWMGFNGGSTLEASPAVGHIIANTVLAASMGTVASFFYAWWRDGVIFPEKPICGMLGGLVAVTAGCMVLDAKGALAVGALGGLLAVWSNSFIEERLKLDDAVGAIGVHGVAGVAGTLGLALLAPVANLPLGDRIAQFAVQAAGAGLNLVWAFGVGFVFFHVLNRAMSLRVSPEVESVGLNEAEHGTRLGVGHVEHALGSLVAGNAKLDMRLTPAEGDESETLSILFNRLMDNLEAEEAGRRSTAERLRDEQESERLSALADATFEAIWIHVDGKIVDGNRKLEDLFGMSLRELCNNDIFGLIDAGHRSSVEDAIRFDVTEPYEIDIVAADGQRIPVQLRGRAIAYRGRPARIGCLVDLRERRDAERRIRHLASHDPLTGLPNRSVFTELLVQMAQERAQGVSPGALLMIDLDRFKDINDVHGHPAGDKVIRVCAERLLALAGSHGTVARLGGDEFAFLAPRLDFANQAGDLAFRIVSQLAVPIELDDGSVVRCGASVGVAICPRDGNTPDKLVSRADTALYHAKNAGRNTFSMFEPGMESSDETRRALEADLGAALEAGQFELYFQPRANIEEAAIVSYEALLRWHHPQRGMVSPADFIPVAEQCGKIVAIGEWVLERACAAVRSELAGIRVSVNVSPVQLRQKGFVDMVSATIDRTGVDPRLIELEITEGVLIDDDRHAHRILNRLKALGVTIALDDFGTGYSSLGYLSRFPFDTIKIDRSFVRELTTSENARAIVRTIIGLGRGLRMNVVAEGVEQLAEARLLAECGCREIQGYLIGHPLPAAQQSGLDPLLVNEIRGAVNGQLLASDLRQTARELRLDLDKLAG